MTLERLGREIAKLQDEELANSRRRSLVRARLMGGSAREATRHVGRARDSVHWSLALAAVAIAALVGFWVGRPSMTQTPTVPRAGAWQTASESAPLPLEFSDGSEIVLAPRARARVVERDENGARVFLERGRAHVAVVHRPSTRWGIEAGPFEVAVTGTQFDMQWEPGEELLSVTMAEGKVEITGCGLGVRRVTTGESVRFACRAGAAVEEHVSESPVASSPLAIASQEPAPTTAPKAPTPSEPVHASTSLQPMTSAPSAQPSAISDAPIATAIASTPASPPEWQALAAASRYGDAFAAVESMLDRECESADSANLLTLANVARLTGHVEEAQRVLLALRRRFSRSPRAAMAAFDLGMLSADRGRDAAGAARWFATYLDEAPQGPLAREALGRLMETESQAGHAARARDTARQYLDRYPTGPRTDLAKSLLGHE